MRIPGYIVCVDHRQCVHDESIHQQIRQVKHDSDLASYQMPEDVSWILKWIYKALIRDRKQESYCIIEEGAEK